jgi:hypothetical protein
MNNPTPATGDPIVDILLELRGRYGELDRRLVLLDELRDQLAAIDPHAIQAAAAQGGGDAGRHVAEHIGTLAGQIEHIRNALNKEVHGAIAAFRMIGQRDPAQSSLILLAIFGAGLLLGLTLGIVGGFWLATTWVNNAWHHTDFMFGAGAALLIILPALGVAAWLRYYR